MHKAERAIIMAAGVGRRLKPLTDTIPKPLINIGGRPIIEGIIDCLHQNGIFEIYIVVGHLKEQFDYLPAKYPGLALLHNPNYAAHNNISSLYIARNHLENAIICDGDLIFNNPDILRPAFDYSGYVSIWVDEVKGEWLQTVDSAGFVVDCSRNGGKQGWQLFSASFWAASCGARLKRHVEALYPHHFDKFWDDIPIFIKACEYRLKIRPVKAGDIFEIDSLQDLEWFNERTNEKQRH